MSPLTSNSYSESVLPIATFPSVRRFVSVPTLVNDEPVTPLPREVADKTSLFPILNTLFSDKSTLSLICHVWSSLLYIIYLLAPVGPNNVIPPPSAVSSEGWSVFPNTIFLSSTISVSESRTTVLPSTVSEPFTIMLSMNVLMPDISWSPSNIPYGPVAP